jgi:mannose-6-phosphate isomerase-like protein (cupin superfamily)
MTDSSTSGADLSSPPPTAQVHFTEVLDRLPGPDGQRFTRIFQHGTLTAELYAPRGHDPQTPHTRDEVYVVVQGRGVFFDGNTYCPCESGTFLFVRAGRVHRFQDFTDDFAVWVIFYGPEGGELPADAGAWGLKQRR